MYYPSVRNNPASSPVPIPTASRQVPQLEVERGRFRDRRSEFVVCSTEADASDSLRVYEGQNRTDLVLVITGICSGDLKASWGRQWRTASDEWREWMEAKAFMAFYTGRTPRRTVRTCNG
ncbi:hypothetical protein [Glycomyces arizonensis]|uniref:hypothetical protein n=1 Tax=Glycomyces arizonensis TaxID=256035 RepID=UPI00041E9948|nr:hypothetical protein [Glycomyces arizonensis]